MNCVGCCSHDTGVMIERYSFASTVLSPLCLQGPSSSSCDPFPVSSFILFPSRHRSSRSHACFCIFTTLSSVPRTSASSYLPFFCDLFTFFSLKMAISHIRLLQKHNKKSRSLDVVKRDASACTSFLLDLQNSYLTTTAQHPARVVSTSPQRWVKP